jgi:uncharacterized protein
MFRIFTLLLVMAVFACAQTAASTPSVQASGSSTISGIQPDQVQLTVGVVTFASSAQSAASQNGTQTNAVIAALHNMLGSNGTIQTIGYSLVPQYTGGTGNSPPSITGYTANNTLQVTTGNLSLAGPLIDAANQAGANSISGPNYGLQNSEPYTEQALTAAAKQALAYAAAIAAGLGAKTGAVIAAQQSSTIMPVVALAAGASAGTPILNGTVSVSANVTVTVALVLQ